MSPVRSVRGLTRADVDLEDYAERIEADPASIDTRNLDNHINETHGRDIWAFDGAVCFKQYRFGRELYCELVSAELAGLLDAPVPAARAVNHPELGVGLINRLLVGYYGVEPDEYDGLANADAIPLLCAFEEWVMNSDARPVHTVVSPGPEGWELHAVDHGATFHYGPGSPVKQMNGTPPLGVAVTGFTWGLDSAADAEDAVDRIGAVTDAEIERVVDAVLDHLRDLGGEHRGREAFFDTVDFHRGVVLATLKNRRDRMGRILENLFFEAE